MPPRVPGTPRPAMAPREFVARASGLVRAVGRRTAPPDGTPGGSCAERLDRTVGAGLGAYRHHPDVVLARSHDAPRFHVPPDGRTSGPALRSSKPGALAKLV